MSSRVGDYILLETIGSGAFGNVKAAVHAPTGAAFAVKVMDKRAIRQAELTLSVRREVAIMKALSHPNIVALHAVLSSRRKIYVVLDLVRGGELFELIASQGPGGLPEHAARRYFRQLVTGVLYCHKKGVVHRDLKPENLLVDKDTGLLKITDFGLSAIKGANTTTELLYTLAGTPNYLAPEVISRAEEGYSGEKVDAWACGIILFALLAGYLPFDEPDIRALFRCIQTGHVEYPAWMPEDAVDLISRLLDNDPNRRYSLAQARNHLWFNKPSHGGNVASQNIISNARAVAFGADSTHGSSYPCQTRPVPCTVNKPRTPGLDLSGLGVQSSVRLIPPIRAKPPTPGLDLPTYHAATSRCMKPPTPGLVLPSMASPPPREKRPTQIQVTTGITASWSSDRHETTSHAMSRTEDTSKLPQRRASTAVSSAAAVAAAESAALVVSKSRVKLSSSSVKRSYTLLRKGVVNYSGLPGFQREHSKVTLGGVAEARRRGVISVDSVASIGEALDPTDSLETEYAPAFHFDARLVKSSDDSAPATSPNSVEEDSESDVDDGCHSLGADALDTVLALRRIQTVIAVSMRDLNAEEEHVDKIVKIGGEKGSNKPPEDHVFENDGVTPDSSRYTIPDESGSDSEEVTELDESELIHSLETSKVKFGQLKLPGGHARRLRGRTTEAFQGASCTLKRPRREYGTSRLFPSADCSRNSVERSSTSSCNAQNADQNQSRPHHSRKRNLFERLVGTVRAAGSSPPSTPESRACNDTAMSRSAAKAQSQSTQQHRSEQKQTRSPRSSEESVPADHRNDIESLTSTQTTSAESPQSALDPERAATLKALRQLRSNMNALAHLKGGEEFGIVGKEGFMSAKQRKETLRLLRVWEYRVLASANPGMADEETSVSDEELLAFQTLLRQWDDQIIGQDRAAHELDVTIPGSVSVEGEIDIELPANCKYSPSAPVGRSRSHETSPSFGRNSHAAWSVSTSRRDGSAMPSPVHISASEECGKGKEDNSLASTSFAGKSLKFWSKDDSSLILDGKSNLASSRLDSGLVLSMGVEGLDLEFGMGDTLHAFGASRDEIGTSVAGNFSGIGSGEWIGDDARDSTRQVTSGEDLNALWGRVLVNNTSKVSAIQEAGSPCSATTSSAVTSPFDDDSSVSPHYLDGEFKQPCDSRKSSPLVRPGPGYSRQETFDASDLSPPVARESSHKRIPSDLGVTCSGIRRPVMLAYGGDAQEQKAYSEALDRDADSDSTRGKHKSRRRKHVSSASGRLMAMLSFPLHSYCDHSRYADSSSTRSKSVWSGLCRRERGTPSPSSDAPETPCFTSQYPPSQCVAELAIVVTRLGCPVVQKRSSAGINVLRLIARVPVRKNVYLSVGIEIAPAAISIEDGGIKRLRDGSKVSFHINKRATSSDFASLGRFYAEVAERFKKLKPGFAVIDGMDQQGQTS